MLSLLVNKSVLKSISSFSNKYLTSSLEHVLCPIILNTNFIFPEEEKESVEHYRPHELNGIFISYFRYFIIFFAVSLHITLLRAWKFAGNRHGFNIGNFMSKGIIWFSAQVLCADHTMLLKLVRRAEKSKQNGRENPEYYPSLVLCSAVSPSHGHNWCATGLKAKNPKLLFARAESR